MRDLGRDDKVENDFFEEFISRKGRLFGNVKKLFERCGGSFEISLVFIVVCRGYLFRCTLGISLRSV